jgi:hypothetical protein
MPEIVTYKRSEGDFIRAIYRILGNITRVPRENARGEGGNIKGKPLE